MFDPNSRKKFMNNGGYQSLGTLGSNSRNAQAQPVQPNMLEHYKNLGINPEEVYKSDLTRTANNAPYQQTQQDINSLYQNQNSGTPLSGSPLGSGTQSQPVIGAPTYGQKPPAPMMQNPVQPQQNIPQSGYSQDIRPTGYMPNRQRQPNIPPNQYSGYMNSARSQNPMAAATRNPRMSREQYMGNQMGRRPQNPREQYLEEDPMERRRRRMQQMMAMRQQRMGQRGRY